MITGATAAVMLISPQTISPSVDPNGNPGLTGASQAPARRGFVAAGAFETSFAGYTSGRFVVGDPDLVTAGYQQASIDLSRAAPSPAPTDDPSAAQPFVSDEPVPGSSRGVPQGGKFAPQEGRLVVYGTGAFDPLEFVKGEKLQIEGRTALLRHAGGPSVPSKPPTGKDGCCTDPVVPTIAWQYLPDSWAAIYWSSFETAPTRDELIALAEDLPAGEVRAFPAGIRMREVLRGYRLIAVSTRRSAYDETNLSVVRLALKPLSGPYTAPVELDDYPSIVLSLGVADQMTSETIGKSSCVPSSSSCAVLVEGGQFYLQVDSTGQRPLSSSELAQILKFMSAEQPADRTSWPPAVKVFMP